MRKSIPATEAVILAGPDRVIDFLLQDSSVDVEALAGEYATLLRIAERTFEDTGAGSLVEQIVVGEKSIMIARSVSPHHFLILVFRSSDQIGRARYELKQAAWEIQTQGI